MKLTAGKGRGRHFLSSWNPLDVSGRCSAWFILCKPSQRSVRHVTSFSGEGNQESEKISDLLRVTKYESHRSEADPEVISCPQTTQSQCPEFCQPGRLNRGLEATAATALALTASLGSN